MLGDYGCKDISFMIREPLILHDSVLKKVSLLLTLTIPLPCVNLNVCRVFPAYLFLTSHLGSMSCTSLPVTGGGCQL